MEFREIASTRRSVRSFSSQPVEEEKLSRILAVMNNAPSAGNLQAFEVCVVRDRAMRKALSEAALSQGFVAAAPVVLVFCANKAKSASRYGKRGEELYACQDATIACTYAMLAAADEGLATTWVGAFDDDAVYRIIGSPEGLRPVAMLPLGYAAENPGATSRRRLLELVRFL